MAAEVKLPGLAADCERMRCPVSTGVPLGLTSRQQHPLRWAASVCYPGKHVHFLWLPNDSWAVGDCRVDPWLCPTLVM